ncbi:hypothetical protein THOB06_40054 [Vibrio rotiferianus]|nr:hypothetical protein THOG10_40054 [Vibrio rotiferianus]CAH1588023.1 hypothetical protein THOB06_40054 [Vibrio rotiferianus]
MQGFPALLFLWHSGQHYYPDFWCGLLHQSPRPVCQPFSVQIIDCSVYGTAPAQSLIYTLILTSTAEKMAVSETLTEHVLIDSGRNLRITARTHYYDYLCFYRLSRCCESQIASIPFPLH